MSGNLTFTVKRVLKLLMLFSIILVFCPSFLVSCSGIEMDISVMSAVRGKELYGETIMEPHPIMLICIFIPIAALVVLFLKDVAERTISLVVLSCSMAEIVIMFIFCLTVRISAVKNMCSFKTTYWFWLDILLLVASVGLNAAVQSGKLQLDFDLGKLVAGETTPNKSQVNEVEKCFCTQCGKEIDADSDFCEYCGKKVIKL